VTVEADGLAALRATANAIQSMIGELGDALRADA
jgi:hypothetical protein